jgi:Flp pilus assembly protein protease CpaA
MVGAMIGIVLTPIEESEASVEWILGALSVAAAICPHCFAMRSFGGLRAGKSR